MSALVLAILSGCSREQPSAQSHLYETLHPVEIKRLDVRTNPLTAGMRQPLEYKPPATSLPRVAGSAAPTLNAAEAASGANYYVDFCDIYWKLNWMRKELLSGSVPYNMEDEIEAMYKKLKRLRHDGNYTAADEALSRMQKGLEHLGCLRAMHAAQINDLQVPWESGATAVQQYFDRNRIAADAQVTLTVPAHPHAIGDDDEGGDGGVAHALPLTPTATPGAENIARSQAIAMAIDYATRYRTSPRTLMQREWSAAIRKTNRLRDNLYLQNRPQNKDGDGNNVDLAVTVAAGDYGTIHVPENAGQTGSAPAMVNYPRP